MNQFRGFSIELKEADSDSETSLIQVFKSGKFTSSRYGEFKLDGRLFREMISNFEENRVPIDFNHGSLDKNSEAAKAAGWVQSLEMQGTGNSATLWATVTFTPKAREMIEAGEYRFVSPEFVFNWKSPEDGEDKGAKILAIALTNRPFLPGMAELKLVDSEGNPRTEESITQKIERVSMAFYAAFGEGENTFYELNQIYPEKVIVARNQKGDRATYQVSFSDGENGIEFAPPEQWVEVQLKFAPIKATEEREEKEENQMSKKKDAREHYRKIRYGLAYEKQGEQPNLTLSQCLDLVHKEIPGLQTACSKSATERQRFDAAVMVESHFEPLKSEKAVLQMAASHFEEQSIQLGDIQEFLYRLNNAG